ncbi:MAG: hypothetical protein CVV06_13385 [Gammaproteobacteria bacterium HGW-Gammaproteobacteria-10]|nr:MAG: hypothetical protein CVV06_13385 [Gammaproteobacteria bacterium HGW-Gammaproteobacteria-10]
MINEGTDDVHGYDAENKLENICYRLFGKDLVLRSPVLLEESGEKELTDILVLIDDIAIIIQSKSMKIDISDLDEKKLQRIINRQNKAIKQINTALNAEKRKTNVKALTPFDVSFKLDWSRIKHKIGIITLSISDDEYNDPEFRFQYPHLAEAHKGIEIHTFLLNDLEQMVKEISTPADMLLYLSCRYKCVISNKFIIPNELDFLGFYKIQYPELKFILESTQSPPAYIHPGYWEEYRDAHKEKIIDRNQKFRDSYPYDSILRALVTGVNYSVEKHSYTSEESAFNYMLMIGKLSKVTRMERAEIGRKLKAKYEKTKNHRYGYFLFINHQYKIAYLFLVVNEKDRGKRVNALTNLCEEAVNNLDGFEQIVGIAMNGAKDNESSLDTLILEDISEIQCESDFPVLFKEPKNGLLNEWD